jgi:hypothetical protein
VTKEPFSPICFEELKTSRKEKKFFAQAAGCAHFLWNKT